MLVPWNRCKSDALAHQIRVVDREERTKAFQMPHLSERRCGVEYDLDIFGQQQSKIYTQICLCFDMDDDDSSCAAVTSSLETGLERLSESCPWLAGQVVNEGAVEGTTGIFKIKSLARKPKLVTKDLRNDPEALHMDKLRGHDFPIAMLDENVLCPLNTTSNDLEAWPVFLIQATFVRGGLLLAFLAHHQTMDMTGQAQTMSLFSQACHNEAFTDEELSIGNVDRRTIIPLLDGSWQPKSELVPMPVEPKPTGPSEPSPSCHWANFAFSAASLIALKSLAMEAVSAGSYVSTDDALSAFVWLSITRARLPRLSTTASTTLGRTVDVRRHFDISPVYPGLAVTKTFLTHAARQLAEREEALGSIASQLRAAVDPQICSLGYETRAFATALHRAQDKSSVPVTAKLNPSTDVMLSSWAKYTGIHTLDFNLGLGRPESVRRPHFTPAREGLVYLLPKSPDGEIVVVVCLREADMERLREGGDWMKYARWIG